MGDGDSDSPALSQDGSVVAFASDSGNLGGPATGDTEVYRSTVSLTGAPPTQTTALVSRPDGATADMPDGSSDTPSISDDGNEVAFESEATNLVADDNNNSRDAFVRQLPAKTLLVSRATGEKARRRQRRVHRADDQRRRLAGRVRVGGDQPRPDARLAGRRRCVRTLADAQLDRSRRPDREREGERSGPDPHRRRHRHGDRVHLPGHEPRPGGQGRELRGLRRAPGLRDAGEPRGRAGGRAGGDRRPVRRRPRTSAATASRCSSARSGA